MKAVFLPAALITESNHHFSTNMLQANLMRLIDEVF